MRRQRRRRGRTIDMPEISMTPLIDTSLTLLIIFMITTPIVNSSIKIDLPEGQAQEVEQTSDLLVISLKESGGIYLNDDAITSENLEAELVQRMRKRSNKAVFVKADKGVSYGELYEFVDKIKLMEGVASIGLAGLLRTKTDSKIDNKS